MNYKEEKKAQILLITILVLMVVAIVVISVIILFNRDVSQVSTNDKYQQAYNISENNIKNIIEKFGDPSVDSSTITSDLGNCSSLPSVEEDKYECLSSYPSQEDEQFRTRLVLSDKKEVSEFEIIKDKPFIINLESYSNGLSFDWDRDIAIELSVVYLNDLNSNNIQDSNETISQLSDIYDRFSIYDSKVGDDPLAASIFNFSQNDPDDLDHSFTFTINAIDGYQSTFKPKLLIITPRTKEDDTRSTKINIVPSDFSTFPYQMRYFESITFDPLDDNTPVATVMSQIPLTPQVDGIFNYSLLTQDNISLE
jgi:hypothetical protein